MKTLDETIRRATARYLLADGGQRRRYATLRFLSVTWFLSFFGTVFLLPSDTPLAMKAVLVLFLVQAVAEFVSSQASLADLPALDEEREKAARFADAAWIQRLGVLALALLVSVGGVAWLALATVVPDLLRMSASFLLQGAGYASIGLFWYVSSVPSDVPHAQVGEPVGR